MTIVNHCHLTCIYWWNFIASIISNQGDLDFVFKWPKIIHFVIGIVIINSSITPNFEELLFAKKKIFLAFWNAFVVYRSRAEQWTAVQQQTAVLVCIEMRAYVERVEEMNHLALCWKCPGRYSLKWLIVCLQLPSGVVVWFVSVAGQMVRINWLRNAYSIVNLSLRTGLQFLWMLALRMSLLAIYLVHVGHLS